jgi:organic hydroperoxide reductase OsmC/OhrA
VPVRCGRHRRPHHDLGDALQREHRLRLPRTQIHTHHSSLGNGSALGRGRFYSSAISAHRYTTRLRWTGSTGLGWDNYDRTHTATAPPAEQVVELTTGESKGDPAILDPEQLLLMSASSCQMLTFLHVAAKARIDVVEYEDDAVAVMPDDAEPMRITEITLRPRITVTGDASEERLRKLVDTAHEHCFIANSLNSEMRIEAEIARR